jgi:hypothetical protein
LALRKLMANGSNGFDTCPYFWSHWVACESFSSCMGDQSHLHT